MFFMLAPMVFGADFKIVSANYDLSNAIVVLSARDTFEENIVENIALKKLENPTRYYFDIDSTILTIPKQDWVFHSGNFERILISQFQNKQPLNFHKNHWMMHAHHDKYVENNHFEYHYRSNA